MNRLLFFLVMLISAGSFWLADRAISDLPWRFDADGRLLRMRIEGEGSPAVILEIGLGGPLEEWDLVQPEVARFTKVVAYDRIGAVDRKSSLTGAQIAHELRTALRNAGVEPPYVLVGQSFGGVYNRVFASLYRDEVVGMVLLDPTQEEFLDWMKVHYPEHTLSKEIVRNWAEGAGVWSTLAQLKVASPLPVVPIVVVTGTKYIDDEMRIKALPMWTASHAKWASGQPRGRHIEAAESGHGVQVEAPELVVKLIREVVDEARNGKHSYSKHQAENTAILKQGDQ
jgi:pimeloyl-ACP methyl ester carboxylesterase